MMKHLPEDEENLKIKSIYCYVISPDMKRKAITTSLLKKVCEDAKEEGFDYVEAYPYIDIGNLSSDFGGYLEMYLKEEFFIHIENEKGIVVRKKIK